MGGTHVNLEDEFLYVLGDRLAKDGRVGAKNIANARKLRGLFCSATAPQLAPPTSISISPPILDAAITALSVAAQSHSARTCSLYQPMSCSEQKAMK